MSCRCLVLCVIVCPGCGMTKEEERERERGFGLLLMADWILLGCRGVFGNVMFWVSERVSG